MTVSHAALVSLAALSGIAPADAIALPAAVERMAASVGMTQAAFVRECTVNKPLRDYVAEVCRKAVAAL